MSGLLRAVEDDTEPEIGAADNVHTIACVEACYRSIQERRSVTLTELLL
jgi:predicted dehydrogenase